jgi:hypothetical protein
MDVTGDSIDMALVTPPILSKNSKFRRVQRTSFPSYSFLELPSIPIPPKRLDETFSCSLSVIQDIVHKHGISGFVVAWPLQADTGKMGYQCGRVWHALEALQRMNAGENGAEDNTHNQLFSCQRPICLWDPLHIVLESHRMDEFGRCSEFARISKEKEYLASKERYQNHIEEAKDHNGQNRNPAVALWNDFCRVHWPAAVAGAAWRFDSVGRSGDCKANDNHQDASPSTTVAKRSSKCLFVDRQLRSALAAAVAAA